MKHIGSCYLFLITYNNKVPLVSCRQEATNKNIDKLLFRK